MTSINDLKKGMSVTVEKWLKNNDRSYIGSVLEIQHIDLPFIIVKEKSKYNPKCEGKKRNY